MAEQRQARREKRPPRPLTPESLRALALHYVGRYATSSGRLNDYLQRKLRERGWEGESAPDLNALCLRFAEAGYIDDQGYAAARRAGLLHRGYGASRVRQALRHAGVGEAIAAEQGAVDEEEARQAALHYARRKRFGPFARTALDQRATDRATASMLRAGHSYALVREILSAPADE